jgi:hypothetical protein
VPRRDGDDAGMITVHLFEQGWLWMIPLPDGIMSVGVVGDRAFSSIGMMPGGSRAILHSHR